MSNQQQIDTAERIQRLNEEYARRKATQTPVSTKLSCTDYLWELFKYAVMAAICFATHVVSQILIQETAGDVKDITFGWLETLIGLGLYYVLFIHIFDCVLLYGFGMECLSTYDSFMLQDDASNVMNIVGGARMEKLDFEGIKRYIIEKSEDLPRSRHKLVKLFGVWYFKKMTDAEFKKTLDWFVEEKPDIRSEQELGECLLHEQTIREPTDRMQYRFLIFTNLSETESFMALKYHHCMGDGQAVGRMMNNMLPNPKSDNVMGMRPLPCCVKLMVVLTLPFTFLRACAILLFRFRDQNPINNNVKQTGRKTGAFTMDMRVSDIKAASKLAGVSLNDFVASCLSLATDEYFAKREKEGTAACSEFKVAMPFSLRPNQNNPRDYVMNNQMATESVKIQRFKSFEKALPHFNRQFNKLKNSFSPFGSYAAFTYSVHQPFNLPKLLGRFVASKVTMAFSNIQLLKCEMNFDNKRQTGLFYFVPTIFGISCGVCVASIGNHMGMSVFGDESGVDDPIEFRDIFLTKYNEGLKYCHSLDDKGSKTDTEAPKIYPVVIKEK